MQDVIKHGNILLLSVTPVNNSMVDLKNHISIIIADKDFAFEEDGIQSVDNLLRRASTCINQWKRKTNFFVMRSEKVKDIDKYRGCLIGGAAGDALGYAVEFLDVKTIFEKYGEKGITEYSLINGEAYISDDTQMTLFTANGLLLGTTRGMTRGIMGKYTDYITLCYKDWYKTQVNDAKKDEHHYSWLINIPRIHASRAPGNTCLTAIGQGAVGSMEEPVNQSKGCGGIMRVAPIGIYFEGKAYLEKDVDIIAAETAAITHGHELGYISAAALVHIIQLVGHNSDISLLAVVQKSMSAMKEFFPHAQYMDDLLNLMEKAINLSTKNLNDLDAIQELGKGWVAEETLAIAIYCSLKYSDDFDKAIIAAVNHSGDSDSTGTVTGNILGAYLGLKAIPKKYIEHLELKDIILEMADDLFYDCKISEYGSYEDKVWEHKYIYHDYAGDDVTTE